MRFLIREYLAEDAPAVNAAALAAFEQFRDAYEDWESFADRIGNTAALADQGEMLVGVLRGGEVMGAVTYVGPGRPKPAFYPVDWPIIRMLVVAPQGRGLGIGRALTEECIRRAERDRASLVALHTTPLMDIALGMYRRMGFVYRREAPPVFGVPYGLYVKSLDSQTPGRKFDQSTGARDGS